MNTKLKTSMVVMVALMVALTFSGCSAIGDWAMGMAKDKILDLVERKQDDFLNEVDDDLRDLAESYANSDADALELVAAGIKDSMKDGFTKISERIANGESIIDAAKAVGKEEGSDWVTIMGLIMTGSIAAYGGRKVGQAGERKVQQAKV